MRFGTDGIRGIYGDSLTEETAFCLGAALGSEGPVLLGRDNRPSSPALAQAVACGVAASGGKTNAVGVITTPALYYLLSVSDCAYAVMVTASHNPPAHNGLKVFTKRGKPTESERLQIEARMTDVNAKPAPFPFREDYALSPYVDYVKSKIGRLDGVKVVVDLAGGAGSVFRDLYATLGADVTVLNARENGDRINEGCGALHPQVCRDEVLAQGAHLGISIDGDGDRIVLVARDGRILDGDHITYLLALRMKARGALAQDKVALTVMTNGGVLKSLKENGITPVSCDVGDAALAETMRKEGLNLGGEQSGHVILGDYLPTGDGLLVGAAIMKSILEEGDLNLTPPPVLYPQVLLNVPVRDKNVAWAPSVRRAAEEAKAALQEGRVLLRPSGTENLVRIMVEHPEESVAASTAEALRQIVLNYA